MAAAQALTARARLHLSPPSPPMRPAAAEGEADAPTPRDGAGTAPPPSPTPLADSASSDSEAGSDGEEARRALSFERGQVRACSSVATPWKASDILLGAISSLIQSQEVASSESPPVAWADESAELPPLASPFSAPPSPRGQSLPPALAHPRRASFTNQPGASYKEPSLVTKMRRSYTS
jgi:hypothetical protein